MGVRGRGVRVLLFLSLLLKRMKLAGGCAEHATSSSSPLGPALYSVLCLALSCPFVLCFLFFVWCMMACGAHDPPMTSIFGSSCPDPSFIVHSVLLVSRALAPKCIQREDRRAERDEESRCVRARFDSHDEHLEGLDVTTRQHDLQLQYLESPYKWVMGGFTCTHTFLQTKDENFKAAKATFVAELFWRKKGQCLLESFLLEVG